MSEEVKSALDVSLEQEARGEVTCYESIEELKKSIG